MHITFVSQYFPPEVNAPAVRTHEHAKEWVEAGHDVTVITGFPNHPDGVIPPDYQGEFFRRETIDGIDVVRTWLYAAPNAGFARRIANYLSFAASSVGLGGLLTEPPDVLVATSPQLFVGLSGVALSRLFDVPFVVEIRDLWPKSIEDMGVLDDRVTIGALEALETLMYRAAERVVIVSESFRDHIAERGVNSTNIEFIPNGIDPEFLDEAESVEVRDEFDIDEDAFLVGYVGTHGMAHGLTNVLDAADELSNEDVEFLFVGDGARRDALIEKTEDEGIDNATFGGMQPRETIPSFYDACDVCLVPLRDEPVFKTVLPSKMFEIMAVGTPMVVSVGGEAERVVSEGDAGVCVPPEDTEAMVEAIEHLAEDELACEKLSDREQEYVWEEFSRPALARRYLELFEDILRSGRSD